MNRKASFPRSRVGTLFVPLCGVLKVNPVSYSRPGPNQPLAGGAHNSQVELFATAWFYLGSASKSSASSDS